MFPRKFLDHVQVEQFDPEPRERRMTQRGTIYVFPLARPGKELKLVVHLQPEAIGYLPSEVKLLGVGQIEFSQFIYP
jgi:hypothetical protein